MENQLIPWLTQELEERGWSMRHLATRAGISHTSVSQVLSGQRPPTWEFCAEVARVYVFRTTDGGQLERNVLRRLLERIGDRAGVQGVTVHRFRHTFAIAFLRNGGHVFALQRMLGHSTMEMVRRYLAIAETDVEKAHRDASPVSNWLL